MLLAVHPMHVQLSRVARGYTGLVFFELVATACFYAILSGSRRPVTIAGFVLASLCAIWFHLYGLWCLLIQACYTMLVGFVGLWRRGAGPLVSRESFDVLGLLFPAVALGSFVLYLPVMPALVHNVVARGRGVFRPEFVAETLGALMAAGQQQWIVGAVALPVMVGLAVARQVRPAFLVPSLAVPLCVVVFWLRPLDLFERFFSYWIPFLVLLGACGLGWLWSRARRLGAALATVPAAALVWIVVAWSGQAFALPGPSGYRETAAYMKEQAASGAVLCALGEDGTLLEHYLATRLPVVHSEHDLDTLAAFTPDRPIACAFHNVPWSSPEHQRLVATLSASTRHEFTSMTVVVRAPARERR
jgi:hypothetical protein